MHRALTYQGYQALGCEACLFFRKTKCYLHADETRFSSFHLNPGRQQRRLTGCLKRERPDADKATDKGSIVALKPTRE